MTGSRTFKSRFQNVGCDVCRHELETFDKPHLVNIFAADVPAGDLSGIYQRVIQSPTHLKEPNGRVIYQNDFVYRCTACQTFWLQQYWEVDTPETALKEFGHRHTRVLPLSSGQVAVIRRALRSGRRLPHDQFV